jgi:hypothetical protein
MHFWISLFSSIFVVIVINSHFSVNWANESVRGGNLLKRSTLSATMNLTGWELAQHLLCTALDDTSSDWKAGCTFEPEIDLTSGLSTFVDTPR